nr:PREDICTED: complexin-1-like [Haliaeetus albicilla]
MGNLGVCVKEQKQNINTDVHAAEYEYGIKKKEEKEAEAQAALEANAEGSLTRPKKAIPPGCGDEEEEEEESILDTVIKYLPGPLQDMFKK